MKKAKILAAVAAAAVLSVGGVLAGCTDNAHKHTYSKDWTNDADGHWHVATCDDLKDKEDDKDYKSGYAEHTWDGDVCSICHYDRTPAPTTTIVLNHETLALDISNTEAELEATITNGEDGAEVEWESDNEAVVQVGETGAVEALKPGSATITATIKGTEISATCDVTVADAYYIIGGQDSDWNKAGAFGLSNVYYFMPDPAAPGIYKTSSFELKKGADFMVAPVGNVSDTYWQKSYNGNYIAAGDEVLSKNQNSNIAVSEHAMYTITLDLTGETPVVSGVMNGDPIPDTGEVNYYLRGSLNNNWAAADTPEAAGDYLFTKNPDGTYTKSINLTRGTQFKVAVTGEGWLGALGPGQVHGAKIADGDSNASKKVPLYVASDNINVGVSGKYDFTINADGIIDYTFTSTADTEADAAEGPDALYYFIKGPAAGGWDKHIELTETGEGTGIYKNTTPLQLAAGDCMFYSTTYSNGNGQYYYFNNSNMKFTANDDSVKANTNYTVIAGYYTIELNLATRTVTFTYSETDPSTPVTPVPGED